MESFTTIHKNPKRGFYLVHCPQHDCQRQSQAHGSTARANTAHYQGLTQRKYPFTLGLGSASPCVLVKQRCEQKEQERGELRGSTYLATSTVAPGTAGQGLRNPGGGPRLKTLSSRQRSSGKQSRQLRWPWRSHHTTRGCYRRSPARRRSGATASTETLDGD